MDGRVVRLLPTERGFEGCKQGGRGGRARLWMRRVVRGSERREEGRESGGLRDRVRHGRSKQTREGGGIGIH